MNKPSELRKALRAEPGKKFHLDDRDAGADHGWERDAAKGETDQQLLRMADLQNRLWAEARHPVLIVLQGIDAAGKDGTIRKVMTAFNPQGCSVASFKVPTAEENAHDFLWRIHKHTPGKGEIAIFNRSQYEEVLVVRVHELEPREQWSRHYEHIRDFEKLLTDTGTTILKFFLHIDRDEQRERFQERYDDPTRRWKFSMSDLTDRKRWDDYMVAYDQALSETSTENAPWYVIPANHKWFRNLAVSSIVADTLDDLKPAYPPEPDLPKDLVIQ